MFALLRNDADLPAIFANQVVNQVIDQHIALRNETQILFDGPLVSQGNNPVKVPIQLFPNFLQYLIRNHG